MSEPQPHPAITLESPITRGEQTITTITLRKPSAGELRGCALADLLRMEVDALATVVPRISTPTLTRHDVLGMDPADLLQIATRVSSFLLTKDQLQGASPHE